MANHGYVHFKEPIIPEEVTKILNNINQEKFDSKLTVHVYMEEDIPSWTIQYTTESKYILQFHCWIRDPHTVEYRHPHGGELIWWIAETFMSMLGSEYKGTKISDDGTGDEKFNPDYHTKYPTLDVWLIARWADSKGKLGIVRTQMMKFYTNEEKKDIPKELLPSVWSK